jgi:hypothetical protein
MPAAITLKLFSIDIHAARFRLAQPHEPNGLTLLTSQGRQVEGLAALSRWPPRRHRIVFSEIVTHSEIATVKIGEVRTPCRRHDLAEVGRAPSKPRSRCVAVAHPFRCFQGGVSCGDRVPHVRALGIAFMLRR